jgi:hypothetical protein
MRRATGPVCIVLQTAPKTTPSPIPRDASRIKERRTQLAPADASGGRRGDGVRFKGVVVASRLGACVWCERRRRAAAMCKLGALLSRSISGARACARRRRRGSSSKCKLGQEVLFWPRRDGGPQFSFARW